EYFFKKKLDFFDLKNKTKPYDFKVDGTPWWLSGVRIQPCHCCGSGYCHGTGSVPALGTSLCHRHSQNKQTNKKQTKKP
ncbi:hypothetical protein, partial [Klebsiella pneumoniae]|uniref:hypothetical protein n=1 Tax=Klebsiella pneumoniae TaxID=573 RepID=UPI0020737801